MANDPDFIHLSIISGGFSIPDPNKVKPKVHICVTNLPQMMQIDCSGSGVTIGGAVTLSKLSEVLQEQIDKLSKHEAWKTRIYKEILRAMDPIETMQIKNLAVMFS